MLLKYEFTATGTLTIVTSDYFSYLNTELIIRPRTEEC